MLTLFNRTAKPFGVVAGQVRDEDFQRMCEVSYAIG